MHEFEANGRPELIHASAIKIRVHNLYLCVCCPGLRAALLGTDSSGSGYPRTARDDRQPAGNCPIRMPGSISGTVVDESGAVVAGARVTTYTYSKGQSPSQEMLSGNGGQFSFANLAPGPFQITIISAGFATQTSSGILHSGENYVVPKDALAVATACH